MKNSFKISFVLMPVILVIVAVCFFYSLWAAEVRRRDELPQDGTGAIARDLLKYHEKTGKFPDNLKQMVGVVWDAKKRREFDADGKVLLHGNVYYTYFRLQPHLFSLWSVPTGARREEGATWFVACTPETMRRYKGAAIPPEQVDLITENPSHKNLAILGLTEQTPVNLKRGKNDSSVVAERKSSLLPSLSNSK
jgi:hypothetical protein